MDVTDEGGETQSSSKVVQLGQRTVDATLSLTENFALEGKAFEIKLHRSSINGDPAKGQGTWELFKVDEPQTTHMPADLPVPDYLKKIRPVGLTLPDDLKQPRFSPNYHWTTIVRGWKAEKSLQKSSVQTDDQGNASVTLPVLPSGTYRVIYKTKDSYGADVEAQTDFFVAGTKYTPPLPGLLLINKTNPRVGDDIWVWATTGFKNQKLVLDVFQDGKIRETRRLSSSENLLLKWKISEEHRGGIGFTLRMLNDYQALNLSQNIFVPWDNKEISVEFATFREKLRPGQTETWKIILSGPKKEKLKRASTQVLAYMYDRSLDQLAPHLSQSVMSLYPVRNSSGHMTFELGSSQFIHFPSNFYLSHRFSHPHSDTPNFYDNYGIGGVGKRGTPSMMVMESAPRLAREQSEEGTLMADKVPRKTKMEGIEKKAFLGSEESDPLAQNEIQIRSNFSETAFFQPNLVIDEKGALEIKFQVPDSVTSWRLWLQGFTKDFMSLSSEKQVQTVKDLMIRPYLPRYLREGDLAELKFLVNNTSDKPISGTMDIDLLDEDKKTDVSKKFNVPKEQLKGIPFQVASHGSLTHKIKLQTPVGLGSLGVQAIAKGKNHSDGEFRVLPILPGRFHLTQSKFVTLKDSEQKSMTFADLALGKDKTLVHEKLVVQIDAQLFYSVLTSLPYLINYPYECIEQTLNRFISTGIVSSIFSKYPAIQQMAQEMSKRTSEVERFDDKDPNRKMSLEETPWLNLSKGVANTNSGDIVNVLDSRIASRTQQESLEKIEKSQTSLGGFPWFSGGPPSPYITLYVLYGFSKALEFGVSVPKPVTQKAWAYLHKHYIDDLVRTCMTLNGCWELVTFLNYTLSNYPDESWGNHVFTSVDRKKMLDYSFRFWKQHSPYLKGYLALSLHRAKRPQDAKLVWDSVMDSAKYSSDEGTHWAREDRSWLWYNDTIETHAFALRTLMELGSNNTKRDGLVQWLFLNKKLNHWKSTRATAEVIYSLAHFLTQTEQMDHKEIVTIKLGKENPIKMEFTPDKYTGKKNQIIFEGEKINSDLLPIHVQKSTPGFMFASANWQFSTEEIPKEDVGDFLKVTRKFYLRETDKRQTVLKPIAEGAQIQIGDEIEVHLSLRSKHPVGYVHLRDPRGAGFEPVEAISRHKWDLGIYWYEEIRDSGTNFFFEQLPQGEYNFKYRIRAATAGEFKVSPATVQPMYSPEFAAYSSGQWLKIIEN